jgi:hypothetical protein
MPATDYQELGRPCRGRFARVRLAPSRTSSIPHPLKSNFRASLAKNEDFEQVYLPLSFCGRRPICFAGVGVDRAT